MKFTTVLLGVASSTLVLSQTPTDATAATTAAAEAGPTQSTGCELHGDHWHCEGAAATPFTNGTASAASATTDAAGTGTLGPSPTASTGCEPHGDHWHCDGPAETGAASGASSLQVTAYGVTMAVVLSMLGQIVL